MIFKKLEDLNKACEEYVFDLFKKDLDTEMVYHNFEHSKETAKACFDMLDHYNVDEKNSQIMCIAAWFHDTGYTKTYKGHEEVSCTIAEEYMNTNGYTPSEISEVKNLILSTHTSATPSSLLEEILHDADYINLGKKRFFRRAELLRYEWEHYLDLHYEDEEWHQNQFEFLKNHAFLTKYAIEKHSKQISKNLIEQAKLAEKALIKSQKSKKHGRGIETMYRAVYRNHINLSSIADSKANMMISTNTIIVSIIIAGIGSGFTFSENKFIEHVRFTVPMAILMLGAFISVVYAILSTSPKVTNKKVSKEKIKKRKSSVLFFGNFVEMELEKFVESLKLLRKDQSMVYDNMSVDLYHLGFVLRKKYRLLHVSYMVFLASLSLCVFSFLFIWLLSGVT